MVYVVINYVIIRLVSKKKKKEISVDAYIWGDYKMPRVVRNNPAFLVYVSIFT